MRALVRKIGGRWHVQCPDCGVLAIASSPHPFDGYPNQGLAFRRALSHGRTVHA